MKKIDFEKLSENIENAVRHDFSDNKIFGSSYFVYQEGSPVFMRCYGFTSTEKTTAVTKDTLFRLASMTKPITAVAALILVDRGLLSLSEPIYTYIDSFRDIRITTLRDGILHDEGKPVTPPTVRDLLTHTSGIGCDPDKMSLLTAKDKLSVDSYVDFHLRTGLDFEPCSRQAYSPLAAFDVMAKIIEIISKTDFQSFLRKEIFAPLAMSDTGFTLTCEQWNRLIKMHNRKDGESVVDTVSEGCVFEDYVCEHYTGGAGLASTLSDYAKFAQMLLLDGEGIVSKDVFRLMRTPQVSPEIMPGNTRWGLGVRVITEESYPYLSVGTYGWSGAYGSHFFVDPENRFAAVYMKNSRFDGGAGNESAVMFEKCVHDVLY